jgi:hypothetical protein
MVKRLTDHDAEQPPPDRDVASSEPEGDSVLAPLSGPESVISASVIKDMQIGAAAAGPVRAFQKTFDAEPGGPDEETHLAYRQATLAAAADEGLRTRGDARLAATRDGAWVYEVSVRPEATS